jgi:nucleoid-associated protein YgaU
MMSRELKLALILGFAAVMVVGVLISDHMSGARSARIEERMPQSPPLALIPPQTPTGGGYEPSPQQSTNDQQFAQALPDNAPEFVEPSTESAEPPVEIAMGEAPETSTDATDGPRTSTFSEFLAWSEKQGVRFDEIRPTAPLLETEKRRTPEQAPQRTLPNPETLRAPQRDATHTVREGDTLWAIAERYYGDGALYTRIEEANKGRMGKGGALYVGATLEIPGATTTPTRQAASSTAREPEKKPATKQPTARDRFHVVKKGETLGDIAKEQLGSARRWPEIVKLNQSVIRDPDNVPAGVRLRLPEN